MSDSPTPIATQLQGLADEIRVKIHLAGMDAKDAWAKLEPRLQSYQGKVHKATDKLASEVTKLGQDLEAEMTKLRDRLKSS
jgi:hypothetical protein